MDVVASLNIVYHTKARSVIHLYLSVTASGKYLQKPGLQINQVIFDTLINSSVTCFHTVFFLVF
jgi:hypothetical protein